MTTIQTLMLLGGIVATIFVIVSLTKKKEEPVVEPQDETVIVEKEKVWESNPHVHQAHQGTQNPKVKRKLRAKRSMPKRNDLYRTRHGYNEGIDLEEVLFLMWLLDDSDVDYDEDFEYEIEDVDGIESVSNIDGVIKFVGESGAALEATREDGLFHVTDGQLANMSYSVNPETGEIVIDMNDTIETVTYTGDNWTTVEQEIEVEEELSVEDIGAVGSLFIEPVVEVEQEFAQEVVVEQGTDSYDSGSSSVDSGSSSVDSGSSSVDSDTAY